MNLKKLFPSLLLFACYFSISAQVLINKAWEQQTGHPTVSLNHLATTRAGGYTYVVGNTYRLGEQENFLITKFQTSGGVKVWEKEYNSITGDRDFGVDISVRGNYVYVTGLTWDSASNDADFVTLKLTSDSGNLVWSAKYSGGYGGYDAAAGILVDDNEDVYVAGSEQVGSSDFRMSIVKYTSGGAQLWVATYDSSGYYDGAVKMAMSRTGLNVTGFSGGTFLSWDYVTFKVNGLGVVSNINRIANPNGGLSRPVAMTEDYYGDLYVLGIIANTPTNSDFKLIKYDTLLNQVWIKTWGSSDSLPDEPNALAVDPYGNLVVTGYTTKPGWVTDMITLKYNNSGTLLWSKNFHSSNPVKNVRGKDVKAELTAKGHIYVTGELDKGSDYDYITVSYTQSGDVRWYKQFDDTTGSNDKAIDLELDANNDVIVSGICVHGSNTKYVSVKYEQYALGEEAVTDTTTGNPLYVKNHVVLKLDSAAVIRSAIDNMDRNFWRLQDVLKSWAIDSLAKNLPWNYRDCKLGRLYTGLKTTHTTSISRLGESIPIPDFWSTFIFVLPTSVITEIKLCDTLNKLFPFVETAELDVLAVTTTAPNDPFYLAQYGMHPTMTYPDFPNSGIDAEGAWSYTTGRPDIKLGVFDDGIAWAHQDFRLDSNDIYSTIVRGGYNLVNDSSLAGSAYPITGIHGTKCAGVIGARRNNGRGIAGVAGGTGSDSSTGCSLYGYTIYVPFYQAIPASKYANALVLASTQTPDTSFGSGLHAINHSYTYALEFNVGPLSYFLDSNKLFWREAFRYSFRNKVVNCSSSGNDGMETVGYPQRLDGDWFLVVGGTSVYGGFQTDVDPFFPGFTPTYGKDVDISALCVGNVTPTTIPFSVTNASADGTFGDFGYGTSLAAPYATGTTGLLLSYLNSPTPSYQNLAPEDIEFILERSAFNVDSPGFDVLTGYGRLNAGGAFSLVDTSKRKILHFNSDSVPGSSVSVQKVGSNETLSLYEKVKNLSGQYFNTSEYKVDVYRVTCNVPHNIPISDTILRYWPRHSSSFTYYEPVLDLTLASDTVINPKEHIYIQSLNYSNAVIYGYVYHLKDAASGSLLGWLPMDTAQIKTKNFAYSILAGDSIYAPWDTLINSIQEIGEGIEVNAYPNPFHDTQRLNIKVDEPQILEVKIYGIQGNLVQSVYEGIVPETITLNVDLADMQSGVYYYVIDNKRAKPINLKILKF